VNGWVAEIAVFTPLAKPLHYQAPPELHPPAKAGARVIVPLGNRQVMGIILSISDFDRENSPHHEMRPILTVLDDHPVMPAELLNLCRWMADYYFYPLGEVIKTALPNQVVADPVTTYRLTLAGQEAARSASAPALLMQMARSPGPLVPEEGKPTSAVPSHSTVLKRLERQGLVARTYEWRYSPPAPKLTKNVQLVSSEIPEHWVRNVKIKALVQLLEQSGSAVPLREVRAKVGNADYWLKKLSTAGMVKIASCEEIRESHFAQELHYVRPPILTPDQRAVAAAVSPLFRSPRFEPFVLHGVTGSGKTEIYLHLVREALEQGIGSLILVPEIALSSQLEALFRQRFERSLAVWHSGLGGNIRYDQWRELRAGNRLVLLGVRSAVFMPIQNLGLIIVDEEHDASLKQDDHLRYHGRDVAIMRARMLKIPILLSSATPSLQSMQNVRLNRHTLLSLPRRIHDRPLPEIQVVDMRQENKAHRILSHALRESIVDTVSSGNQLLLFLNRRGFSSFLLCSVCGEVVQCPHCSVSLTYHQSQNLLCCHYCGWKQAIPEHCPTCDHAALIRQGFGTERVEDEVRKLLPNEPIVRIDRDTVKQSARIIDHLNTIRRSEAKVLIGTQMIAKGHDFPNMTLVGIINSDTALQIPDYRSAETTVQLLMQVSGRAGRGEIPGRVLLQTYNPTHYTIEATLQGDYQRFCETELGKRKSLQYPPFTKFVRFLLTDTNEIRTQEAAHQLAEICSNVAVNLKSRGRHVSIMGPAPAPLQKLNNRHRYHVMAKTWTNGDLQDFTTEILSRARSIPVIRRVSFAVDRDPVNTL
jgi:primosomal protein N' (replication factor Y) (superfamily II helicase)